MASIKLQHLMKKYGSTVVVHDVTLDVADNEFLVLVGPSGCGKTTTLRMVAGLEEISGGDVFIGDRRVTDVAAKDRDIAMVFQNYALYPHMSVYDNMAFGLRQRKTSKAEMDSRIQEAAAMLGLSALLARRPKDLSGGQRQRVALGRAIVREPAVFLMDEPLSNLDAQVRLTTRTELLRIHQRVKNTVMYVTHDQVEAMTMGDRIVVMKDGLVQQVAAPRDIYNHPANAFVASFIGSPPMNFFDATFAAEADAVRFAGPTFGFRRAGSALPGLAAAATRGVRLGVRPENIALDRAAGPDAIAVPARVEVVETLGAEQHVLLKAENATFLARASGELVFRPGDNVVATIDPQRIHVFDADDGRSYLTG